MPDAMMKETAHVSAVGRGGRRVLRTTSVLHLFRQSPNSPLPFVTLSTPTLPNLVNLIFRVSFNTLTLPSLALCHSITQTHTHQLYRYEQKKKNYRLQNHQVYHQKGESVHEESHTSSFNRCFVVVHAPFFSRSRNVVSMMMAAVSGHPELITCDFFFLFFLPLIIYLLECLHR